MPTTLSPEMQQLVGFLFTLLMGGNIFFLKRVMDRIDIAHTKASDAEKSVEGIEDTIEKFLKEIAGIRQDLREIHKLDKQLSKLEAQLQLLLAKDGYFSGHGD